MRGDSRDRLVMGPCPLRNRTVGAAHMHLKMHVRNPARIPSRNNRNELAFAIFIRNLISAAIRQSHFGIVAGIPAHIVTMPNVHPHIGHGLAIFSAHNAHALPQLDTYPIFPNVLPKEKGVVGQIQRKRTGCLSGHNDAIGPRCHWVGLLGSG